MFQSKGTSIVPVVQRAGEPLSKDEIALEILKLYLERSANYWGGPNGQYNKGADSFVQFFVEIRKAIDD